MNEYAGSKYLKADDMRDGPRREKIKSVDAGGFERPEATFESGDVLSLNKTNVKTLIRAYGNESDDWIACEVELYLGKTEYRGEMTDSILIRPITPPKPTTASQVPTPTRPAEAAVQRDLNDDIPF